MTQKRRLEKLLEVIINKPDYERPMIDANHIKVYPQAAGDKGGNQDMLSIKRALVGNIKN